MNLKKTIAAVAVAALAVTAPTMGTIPNPFNITVSAEDEYKAGDTFIVCTKHLNIPNDENIIENCTFTCIYMFSCTVLDDGTLSVSAICPAVGKTGNRGDLTIPSEIIGHTVTKIEFLEPTNTTVTIPSTVTEIADNALEYREGDKVIYNEISEIFGEAGSYAETFANEKGIKFTAISAAAPADTTSVSAAAPTDTTSDTEESKTDAPSEADVPNSGSAESSTVSETSNDTSSDSGQSNSSSKANNPDTGVAAVASVAGVAVLAGGTAFIVRRKRK